MNVEGSITDTITDASSLLRALRAPPTLRQIIEDRRHCGFLDAPGAGQVAKPKPGPVSEKALRRAIPSS